METPPPTNERTEPRGQHVSDWTRKRFLRIACWTVPTALIVSFVTKIGHFWWHCVGEGLDIGEGWMGRIEVGCLLVAAALRWAPETHFETWEKKWEPMIMKWAFAIAAVLFFVTTMFVAPFLKYEESEKKKKDATDELAKLTPMGATTNYGTLAKLLTEKTEEAEKEKIAVADAEKNAWEYRQRWINSLMASTNSSTVIPLLNEAMAAAMRDRDSLATNPSGHFDVLLQRDAEIKKLHEKIKIEKNREIYVRYDAMLHYVIATYHDRLASQVRKCGAVPDPLPNLPAIDWWLTADNSKASTINTYCGATVELSFVRRDDPTLSISIEGKKSAPALAEFILSHEPFFHTRLTVGDYRNWTGSELVDPTNCLKQADFILGLLFESQKEYFQ